MWVVFACECAECGEDDWPFSRVASTPSGMASGQERESALTVEDPEIVRVIDFNMRMLWTAEIQAGHRVLAPIRPFRGRPAEKGRSPRPSL